MIERSDAELTAHALIAYGFTLRELALDCEGGRTNDEAIDRAMSRATLLDEALQCDRLAARAIRADLANVVGGHTEGRNDGAVSAGQHHAA